MENRKKVKQTECGSFLLFLAVYQIVYKKFVFLNLFPYFCTVKPKMQEL